MIAGTPSPLTEPSRSANQCEWPDSAASKYGLLLANRVRYPSPKNFSPFTRLVASQVLAPMSLMAASPGSAPAACLKLASQVPFVSHWP